MKKKILFFAAMVLSIVASAQVNLSGSWKLNTEKSKLEEQTFAPKEIVIIQNGNDLSVERHSEWEGQVFTITDKLTFDGKECLNTGMMDTQKKSKITVSDDQKSIKISSEIPLDDGVLSLTEVYKIEGENMIIESSASSSFGVFNETQVFDKL